MNEEFPRPKVPETSQDALRYLERNPVRAGLADDSTSYPRSKCAAYALGTTNPLVTLHLSYLALSP
jgi:hypothetical protein